MGPRHSFWSVLGPAAAPKFGPGSHASRGAVNPAGAEAIETVKQAKVHELVVILGEAIRVASRSQQLFARIREHCGLSGIEALTLIGIVHAAAPPTVPQIGRSLGHPRQVIQRAARELEQRGLIQPQPNPGHKRAALLVATEAGRALGRSIDGQAAEIIADLADGLELDLDMLSAMGEGLLALRDRIDERMGDGG